MNRVQNKPVNIKNNNNSNFSSVNQSTHTQIFGLEVGAYDKFAACMGCYPATLFQDALSVRVETQRAVIRGDQEVLCRNHNKYKATSSVLKGLSIFKHSLNYFCKQ